MKYLLIVSIAANIVVGAAYNKLYGEFHDLNIITSRVIDDQDARYETLRVWACEHGNGGQECGEE